MRKINFPLIIGTIIVVFLIIASFYPGAFTNVDPYGTNGPSYYTNEEGSGFNMPPYPPSKEYPWGSDWSGRDMKSIIFYGCKNTIMIAIYIAIGRMLVSFPIAIGAAYKNRFCRWLIKQFNILFGAIPVIVVVIILSNKLLLYDLFGGGYMLQVFILVLIGWSRFAKVLSAKISEILNEEFIEGEIALGKSKFEIAYQNVLPHVIPTIVVLFFMEIAIALLTITQIAVFGVIFGGGMDGTRENQSMTYEFDWAYLLAASNYVITSGQNTWMIFYPLVAFATSIIGFNLFGEGLKMEFEKRESRVITFIRKIPSILSPFKYIYQIRNYKSFKKNVLIKSAVIILVLIIMLLPQRASLYRFDSINAFNTVSELSSDKYEGRLSGTEQGNMAAEYIADLLKKYNIKPFEGSYLHEFQVSLKQNNEASTLTVNSDSSAEFDVIYMEDYKIDCREPLDADYDLYVLNDKDYKNLSAADSIDFQNRIVVVDARGYKDYEISRTVNYINAVIKPKGIAYIEDWYSGRGSIDNISNNKLSNKGVTLSISSNVGDKLLKLENPKVRLTYMPNTDLIQKGYNVAGYIEGTDKSLENEVLIIGSSYDYIGDYLTMRYPGAMAAGGTAIELEIARVLSENELKPKRTIIFVFWDGTNSEKVRYLGSTKFVMKYLNNADKIYYNFDLRNFASEKSRRVFVDANNIKPNDSAAQSFIREIKKNANKNNVKLDFGLINSPIKSDMNFDNKYIIIFDGEDKESVEMTSEDTADKIGEKQLGNVGQMLLDTIVSIECNN